MSPFIQICIAEAEEIVQAGDIDPDQVHLSGIYVDKLILATDDEKRIERVKTVTSEDKASTIDEGRNRIMKRLAKEFKDGMYVNLGIGTNVSNRSPVFALLASWTNLKSYFAPLFGRYTNDGQ